VYDAHQCCDPIAIGNQEQAVLTQSNLCPTCGHKGKKVDSLTLKAMLNVSLLALREVPYRFCPTAACPVVYFATDGRQSFTKEQIRERVHQKEPNDESVLVCYCFYHSPQTIRGELLARGTTTVVEEITEGIQASQCACEVRNPQGSCCLGNVQVIVEQIRHKVG
jgi:hypothetical protein